MAVDNGVTRLTMKRKDGLSHLFMRATESNIMRAVDSGKVFLAVIRLIIIFGGYIFMEATKRKENIASIKI